MEGKGWCSLALGAGNWVGVPFLPCMGFGKEGKASKRERGGGGAREGSLGVLGGRCGTISFVFFFSLGPGVETKNVFTWGMFLGILGRRGGGWGTTLDKFYGTRC